MKRTRKCKSRKCKSRKIKGGMMDDLDLDIDDFVFVTPRQTSDILRQYASLSRPSEIARQYASLSRQTSDEIARQYASLSRQTSDLAQQYASLSRETSDIAQQYASLPIQSDTRQLYSLIRQPSEEFILPEFSAIDRQTSDEIDSIVNQFRASTNAFTDLCNKHIMNTNLD